MPIVATRRRPAGKHGPLLWHDEFDGGALDTTKWAYADDTRFLTSGHVSVNNSAAQCTVANGMLTITASFTTVNGRSVSSGCIYTYGTQAFGAQEFGRGGASNAPYGYYEARIRVPATLASWPAFWMLCHDYFPAFTNDAAHPYGTWEVDFVEWLNHTGGSANVSYNNHSRFPTTGTATGDCDWDNWFDPNGTFAGNTLYAPNWHVYGCSVSATAVSWYFDDTLMCTMPVGATTRGKGGALTNSPSAIMPYRGLIILQLDEGSFDEPTISAGNFPHAMDVDWVRVWRDP